jgi:hypothetical protein
MKILNLLAEILGFLSGCMLLWPAITNNMHLWRIVRTSKIFKKDKVLTGFDPSKTLKDAARPQWSPLDQWLLTVGALLLIVSFGLKCFVVWNSP